VPPASPRAWRGICSLPRGVALLSEKNVWTGIAVGSAILAGVAVRSALKTAWRQTTGEPPPLNPAHPDTSWKQGLLWTAALGAAVGVSRMLARRGAAAAWELAREQAPPLDDA
jgi:hypothetical protein